MAELSILRDEPEKIQLFRGVVETLAVGMDSNNGVTRNAGPAEALVVGTEFCGLVVVAPLSWILSTGVQLTVT